MNKIYINRKNKSKIVEIDSLQKFLTYFLIFPQET